MATIFLICLSMFSHLLSEYIFYAQLFAHFQLQYAIVLLICSVLLLVSRQYFLAGMSIAYVILLYCFFLHPLEIFPHTPKKVDVFFMNVYGKKNTEMRPIVDYIQKHNPPVVAIVEANDDIIHPLTKLYGPPHISETYEHFHCVVFSIRKVVRAESVTGFHTPVCVVEFSDYTLMVIHTHSPLIPSVWKKNQDDLYAIGKFIHEFEKKNTQYLVVGDFNSSPYSYPFRKVLGGYVKKNVYTWQPGKILTLPLDYALSNMSVRYHRTPEFTSDHAGLLIDVGGEGNRVN